MQIFFNHGGHGMSFFNRLEDGISVTADIRGFYTPYGSDVRGFYIILLLYLPLCDIFLLRREVDANFYEFSAVHLETSGVILFVDLVEGGLCIAVHLKFKEIDVIVVDHNGVRPTLRRM